MRSSPSDLPSLSCWSCCSFSPCLAPASGSSLSSSPAEQVVLGSLDPVGLLPGAPCSLPQPLVCSSIACLSTLPCFGFRGSQADGDGFHDTFRFLVCSCEAQLRPFLLAFLKVFLYLLISLFKKFLINLKRVYENVAGCRDDQWLRAHAALTEDPFGAEYNHL